MKNKKILTTGITAFVLLFVSVHLKAEVKKYVRYTHDDVTSFGLLEGETVYQLEKAPYLGGGKTGKDYDLKEISYWHRLNHRKCLRLVLIITVTEAIWNCPLIHLYF